MKTCIVPRRQRGADTILAQHNDPRLTHRTQTNLVGHHLYTTATGNSSSDKPGTIALILVTRIATLVLLPFMSCKTDLMSGGVSSMTQKPEERMINMGFALFSCIILARSTCVYSCIIRCEEFVRVVRCLRARRHCSRDINVCACASSYTANLATILNQKVHTRTYTGTQTHTQPLPRTSTPSLAHTPLHTHAACTNKTHARLCRASSRRRWAQ